MPKAPDHRTSAPQWDGQLAFTISSGVMLHGTGALVNQAPHVAPCDLEIVSAIVHVVVAATHASAALQVGTRASAAKFLTAAEGNVQNLAAGVYEFITKTWASKKIKKGDVVEFHLPAASAVGSIAVTLVCMPGSQG